MRKFDAALEVPLGDTFCQQMYLFQKAKFDLLSSRCRAGVITSNGTNKGGNDNKSWTRAFEKQIVCGLEKYDRTKGVHFVVVLELVDGCREHRTVIIRNSCP